MSLIFQSKHIASSIVYTLWERTFTVSLSLEKGRTYFFFGFLRLGFMGVFACATRWNGHREERKESLMCEMICWRAVEMARIRVVVWHLKNLHVSLRAENPLKVVIIHIRRDVHARANAQSCSLSWARSHDDHFAREIYIRLYP